MLCHCSASSAPPSRCAAADLMRRDDSTLTPRALQTIVRPRGQTRQEATDIHILPADTAFVDCAQNQLLTQGAVHTAQNLGVTESTGKHLRLCLRPDRDILGPCVTDRTQRVSCITSHATIKAVPAAACLLKIAHRPVQLKSVSLRRKSGRSIASRTGITAIWFDTTCPGAIDPSDSGAFREPQK
jgi:hypothetical protein